jgi:hypothetical protein
MAITLDKDDMQFTGVGSDGKRTATRHMVFGYNSGDDTMDLAESTLLPNVGDLHPQYTAWTVSSIGEPKWTDSPKQFSLDVQYSMGGRSGGGSSASSSKGNKPWELGPQNYQESTYDIEEPLLELYQYKVGEQGYTANPHPLNNTAGDRVIATTPQTVRRITFQLHYKHKEGKMAAQNDDYSYNSKSETVCNITIPPYAGKLMPFSTSLHTVYKADGVTVDYEYETAEITIDIRMKKTWKREFLNVGTQAFFLNFGSQNKGAVYKYHKITSPSQQMTQSTLSFGSLEEALAAREVYTKAGGKGGNFPIEELTEPFPLTYSGTFDEEKYKNGGDYLIVSGYDREGESWSKFNFPKKI